MGRRWMPKWQLPEISWYDYITLLSFLCMFSDKSYLVNMTETLNALAMITKAGVEARQIVVGVASYGRSFKMTDSKCKGAMCRFVGPQPAAAKGECTNSSNAEILDIMDKKEAYSVQTWYDEKTDSDYLIYNSKRNSPLHPI